MPAGSTYSTIATTTLGSDAADYTFTSIPGTYTDLVLVANLGVSVADTAVTLRFNGDNSSVYSATNVFGDGSSASSSRTTSLSSAYIGWYVVPLSSIDHLIVSQIMNYSNTTTNKTVMSRSNRASANNFPGSELVASLWRSTSAITSIRIAGGGNLKAGSTFTLYGIAAA